MVSFVFYSVLNLVLLYVRLCSRFHLLSVVSFCDLVPGKSVHFRAQLYSFVYSFGCITSMVNS